MAYRVVVAAEAADHLDALAARDRAVVLSAIQTQLFYEPAVETRNRRRMRPNTLAQYRPRVRHLRVYDDVEDEKRLVRVKAVDVKVRNRVYVGGQEIQL